MTLVRLVTTRLVTTADGKGYPGGIEIEKYSTLKLKILVKIVDFTIR
jgi:hypothetical protein